MTIFNIYVTEKYTAKDTGEEKTSFTRVGTGFPHKDGKGMNLVIPDGVAISGRVMVRERKAGEEKPDASAAEHFNDEG